MSRLSGGLFGSSGKKKKKRASFGGVAVKSYIPNSDEKKVMHGARGEDESVLVVVYDMSMYKSWRRCLDAVFVDDFNLRSKELSREEGLQTLHAARVMDLLRSLDAEKVRDLSLRLFPRKYKKSFPRLKDKDGNCQKEVFLTYLNKRLVDHVKLELENDEKRTEEEKVVCPDRVGQHEREYKQGEYEHLAQHGKESATHVDGSQNDKHHGGACQAGEKDMQA